MNVAISPQVLAHIAEADIAERLNFRAAYLESMRGRLKCFVRTNGRMNAQEAQDMLCCLAECLGDDIREIKASLTDISVDLDGLIHYEAPDPRDD
ncbi:hypothetical protein J7E70_08005 [Variovorax paradoxus]|nr:hypothetical protein [Variovorax paradoxus]MBT2300407.1 hypothetical protein [Variovorax paradoxus]